MDLLVTTDWLAAELGDDDVVVLDCTVFLGMDDNGGYTSVSGRAKFEQAHIPGAGFGDLMGDLVDVDSPNRFAMPTPEAFAAAMEQLGVHDGSRVVLYDADDTSMWAARAWFMLRWIGFDNAAILDGGIKAWQAAGHPTETGAGQPIAAVPGSLTVSPRPEMVAHKDEVMAIAEGGATCLIDALPKQSYNGEFAPYGRPGHIPNAINIPGSGMVDAETGLFRPLEEVRGMFPDRPEARTVAY